MTMHMGVVAVAAPLIALGVAGTSYDPVRQVPALFAPLPASIFELIVVWVWHAHSAVWLVTKQGMFLLSGLLLWLSACGGEVWRSGARRAAGVGGADARGGALLCLAD
jgi:putative membrane protein